MCVSCESHETIMGIHEQVPPGAVQARLAQASLAEGCRRWSGFLTLFPLVSLASPGSYPEHP